VLSVPDGVRAVEAVRLDDFDLVIMDLRVPAPDGLGALRRIRALPGDRGSVPVVAVAGDLEPEIRALLLAAGLDGFLWKPIRFRDLAATVQALRAGAAIPRQRRA
jgi:CheY-like chemotaxis protein